MCPSGVGFAGDSGSAPRIVPNLPQYQHHTLAFVVVVVVTVVVVVVVNVFAVTCSRARRAHHQLARERHDPTPPRFPGTTFRWNLPTGRELVRTTVDCDRARALVNNQALVLL